MLSILAGLCSGLGGAGLIATINLALDGKPVAGLAWIFTGLCVLMVLARAASSLLLVRLGQNAVMNLRLELSYRILQAPLARLQELGPPRILACLTEDVTTLTEAFKWLPILFVNTAIVAGCLANLAWLSWGLMALVCATLILGIGSFRLISGRALSRLAEARDYDDRLYGHFRSLTQGIKELKLHDSRREAFVRECLQSTASHYRRHYVSGMGLYILAGGWGQGLFYALIGVVLFFPAEGLALAANALRAVNMEDWGRNLFGELTPTVLRGYCLTILYMIAPLSSLIEGLPVLGRAGIALEKIKALGKASEAGDLGVSGLSAGFPSPAVLELAGVSHRYWNEKEERCFTLGPIDLVLRPGELVFVIGGNGSGKTTLALILAGLYAPEQGEIRLGGQSVTPECREAYRQQFSAVFSDFHLFETLLGFDHGESSAEARTYLTRLHLDHKVRIEDGTFSTLDLSQGQRKRLALLVAYLEDRPFYVFDEWAADQDPVFKNIFYTEILPTLKARGKTVIVITHDDAYFHLADRCIVLQEGKLKETRKHGREPITSFSPMSCYAEVANECL